MKITKSKLTKLIKEEVAKILRENSSESLAAAVLSNSGVAPEKVAGINTKAVFIDLFDRLEDLSDGTLKQGIVLSKMERVVEAESNPKIRKWLVDAMSDALGQAIRSGHKLNTSPSGMDIHSAWDTIVDQNRW